MRKVHLPSYSFSPDSWLRASPSGETTAIEGADQMEYEVTSSDVGFKLQFHYQPLSEAGAIGEAQLAETEVVQAGGL